MKFGDRVKVTSRPTDSSQRTGYFVRKTRRSRSLWIEVTDKQGKFWWAKASNVASDPGCS